MFAGYSSEGRTWPISPRGLEVSPVIHENRVRCSKQKTQGSLRCPPTGIHPCNNGTEPLHIFLILKLDGAFGTQQSEFLVGDSVRNYCGPQAKNFALRQEDFSSRN